MSLPVLAGTDRYYLFGPDGERVVDIFQARMTSYSASSGRYPDGGGVEYAFEESTGGAPNELSVRDDIYISEIMYHPAPEGDPPVEPLGLEYIGISNRGDSSVELTGWYFSKGVSLAFDTGTEIAPGQELIVASNPALVRP